MGFSVSGSAAIVFAGVILSFGIVFGAVSNSYERVTDAEEGQTDRVLAAKNADINITGFERAGDRLSVYVNNTGSHSLSLNRTDFILDNEYRSGWQDDARVNGENGTYLWLPGERLNITVVEPDVPTRAKVVTEHGIADTVVVN